ncbi:MAG: AraC family transcriptional regulator [Myxococcales bacterium FL481]|nr:MAG: AraC family transcriptional regulator [Myxococcales bacterium FL481]
MTHTTEHPGSVSNNGTTSAMLSTIAWLHQAFQQAGLGATRGNEWARQYGDDAFAAHITGLSQSAASNCADPCFGLRFAETLTLDRLGDLANTLRSGATLTNAILAGSRYLQLQHPRIDLELHIHGMQAAVVMRCGSPHLDHPIVSQAVLGAVARLAKMLTGHPLADLHVQFRHYPTADAGQYERFFGAPVAFAQPYDALVFSTASLEHRVLSSESPRSSAHNQTWAEALEMTKQSLGTAEVTRRVLDLLASTLRDGEPTSTEVAEALGMHPKTLSRRLRAEGTGYQRLLNQLRQRLAERYLMQPDLTVSQVATRLGYSENSTFCRAFKRWTGHPPQAFRRHVLIARA